jgi:hypothetical protein
LSRGRRTDHARKRRSGEHFCGHVFRDRFRAEGLIASQIAELSRVHTADEVDALSLISAAVFRLCDNGLRRTADVGWEYVRSDDDESVRRLLSKNGAEVMPSIEWAKLTVPRSPGEPALAISLRDVSGPIGFAIYGGHRNGMGKRV